MLVGYGAGDIESGEEGKDVCLEALNHELEEGHADADNKSKGAHELEADNALQEMLATENKDQEQEVAGKHICKETKCKSEWAN